MRPIMKKAVPKKSEFRKNWISELRIEFEAAIINAREMKP